MLSQISSLNYLKTFALAAQTLSFKQTARLLNISPTAVSHQIKALESQLRVSLFERQTRAIYLTQAGAKLAEACKLHLTQLDNILSEIQYPRRDISLSCCQSFAALWLTPRSTEINAKFPNHTLKICASDSLVDLTREQHIDIALRYGDDAQDIDEMLLYTERQTLYQHPNFQAHKSKPRLFVTQWPDNGMLANINWQQHINDKQLSVTSFEQEYFVLQAIMTGQGVGLLSDVLSNTAVKQGWIVPVDKAINFEGYSYWLRFNAQRQAYPVIKEFGYWLKREFGKLHH